MRSKVALLLVVCVCTTYAQNNTYGKSEAQILAMGQDAWEKFYSKKAGDSTMAMSQMKDIFGEAAKHRNDRLLAKTKPALRAQITKLRQFMGDLANSCVNVGYNITGGGTLWTPVSAGIAADVELALYPILGGPAKHVPRITVGNLTMDLDTLRKAIGKAHGTTGFDARHVKMAYGRLRVDLARVGALVKGLSPTNTDRVFGFCRTYLRLGTGNWD